MKRLREWWRGLFCGDWSGPLTLQGWREWFEIKGWSGQVKGWFPRDVLEAWGVNCRPADDGFKGAIFFTRETGERMRKHPEYKPPEWGAA